MINVPRWYYRIDKFNTFYNMMIDLYKKSDDNHEIMDAEKDLFVVYWEFIRDCLKSQNIRIPYPIDIFRKAKELNLISDADTWIEFIHDLNVLNFEQNLDKRKELHKYFVETYISKFESIHKTLNELKASIKYNTKSKRC